MNADGKVKNLLLKGISTFISVIYTTTIWLFSYFGLTEWFMLTFSLVVTLLVSLVTNTMSVWNDLPNQILLFIIMIPIFELMISINTDIFVGFFRQLGRLNPNALIRFIPITWNKNTLISRFHVIASFVIIAILLILLIIQLTVPTMTKWSGMTICGICLITPCLAVCRVFISCWRVLLGRISRPVSGSLIPLPLDSVSHPELSQIPRSTAVHKLW
jgi:hypothetical protein